MIIIKKRREFIDIQNNYDKKYHSDILLILIKKNISTRFGYIVSKKVDKKAVVRNKIKRIFREISRMAIKDNIVLNNDYEIIAKKDIINKSFWEIKDTIYSLLKEEK